MRDAIECLPRLPDTDSVDEVRLFLRNGGLHYSGEQTRHRYANYITSRMFPANVADGALRRFAKKYAGKQALRDVCLYRFMKAEPLMQRIVLELLFARDGTWLSAARVDPAVSDGAIP